MRNMVADSNASSRARWLRNEPPLTSNWFTSIKATEKFGPPRIHSVVRFRTCWQKLERLGDPRVHRGSRQAREIVMRFQRRGGER